jgi:uncharacterized membrane protein
MAQALREPTGNGQSSPLQSSLQTLMESVTDRAMSSMTDRLSGATDRLTDYAQGSGGNLMSAVTGFDPGSPVKSILGKGVKSATDKVKDSVGNVLGSLTGSKGKGGNKMKVTNIVEQIDIGVPINLAYDQWTQFAEFPKFMKKVENVEQVADEKLKWKAQVFWSHRTWESTIVEQVPNERIVWRSTGDKGYVDGAVTFHELGPNLTRVILVLEYHPKGFFEKTGNLWRAPGRRVRLEFKHIQRHVMSDALLHPQDVEGWHGEIRDSEVVSEDSEDETEEETQSSARKPRKSAARSGSGTSTRRPAAKTATSSRRQPTSSRRQPAKKSTGSSRKQALKSTSSTRQRTPTKKRS